MALTVNDPHVHKNSFSLILSDSCTSENLRTKSIWRRRISWGTDRVYHKLILPFGASPAFIAAW